MDSRQFTDVPALYAIFRSGDVRQRRERLQDLANAHAVPIAKLHNALMLDIARRFMAGEMPFEDADQIANEVYAVMVEDAVAHGDGFVLPEPAFAIYEAFDAGEWDRGDGSDPVAEYTKPALSDTLSAPRGRKNVLTDDFERRGTRSAG